MNDQGAPRVVDGQAVLERCALGPSYGRLTGVAIACHAIADGYLLLHAGVGCKDKVTHLLAHDWERHCNLRQGWTEVGDRNLVAGAAHRVGPYVRSWQQRMGSGLVCVVPASFLEMTGDDLAAEVKRVAADVPVPVLLVRAPGHDGDLFDGYAALCRHAIGHIDWRQPRRRHQVALLGYWFDRYEGDHLGNLAQLRGMLQALGLELGPVLLSGTPFGDLLAAGQSAILVELPYLIPARHALTDHWRQQDREPVPTDLPMGFAGTRRWLQAIGAAAAVDRRLVAAYADKRERRARQPLDKMASRWRSSRVAVLAEPPLAAGYCGMLLELGLEPAYVGLRGESLGGRVALEEALGRSGLGLPQATHVVEAPSLGRLQQDLGARLWDGDLAGVLGSATELQVLLGPDPAARVTSCVAGRGRGPFVLEIGFPSWHYHAVQQMPFMGYGGMVTLAQRLVDPPRLWDIGRGALE